jgi:hypothetical protein
MQAHTITSTGARAKRKRCYLLHKFQEKNNNNNVRKFYEKKRIDATGEINSYLFKTVHAKQKIICEMNIDRLTIDH